MDIEQLKLILSTLQGFSVDAKEGFIWWLVLDRGLSFILHAFFWSLFAYVILKVVKTIKDTSENGIKRELDKEVCHGALKAIRKELEVYTYPSLREDSTYYDQNAIAETLNAIAKLKNAN